MVVVGLLGLESDRSRFTSTSCNPDYKWRRKKIKLIHLNEKR